MIPRYQRVAAGGLRWRYMLMTSGVHRLRLGTVLILLWALTLPLPASAMTKPSLKRWKDHVFDRGKLRLTISVPKGSRSVSSTTAAILAANRKYPEGQKPLELLLERSYVYRARLRQLATLYPHVFGTYECSVFIAFIPENDIPAVDQEGLGQYMYRLGAVRHDDPRSLGHGSYKDRASLSEINSGSLTWNVWTELSTHPSGTYTERSKTVKWAMRLDRNSYLLVHMEYIRNIGNERRQAEWYSHAQRVEQEIIRRIKVEGLSDEYLP